MIKRKFISSLLVATFLLNTFSTNVYNVYAENTTPSISSNVDENYENDENEKTKSGEEISSDSIYKMIEEISTNYPDRSIGSENNSRASSYIKEKLENNGYTTEYQEYTAFPIDYMNGKRVVPDYNNEVIANNIIAKLPNYDSSKKDVIISAHFDSVLGTPGANDNASGVAMAIEISKYLKSIENLPYNPVFVIVNGEEVKFSGSKYYVNNLTEEERNNIELVITLDMVAYGNHYELWNTSEENRNSEYNQVALNTANELGLNIVSHADSTPWGDYYIFENNGLPTVTFMMDDFDNWHSETDTIELIDKESIKNISIMVLSVLNKVDSNLKN